jgi:hypothetical protein
MPGQRRRLSKARQTRSSWVVLAAEARFEVCRFSGGILLRYYRIVETHECTIVWHDITSNLRPSMRIRWCLDCPSFGTIVLWPHRRLVRQFRPPMSIFGACLWPVFYIDTASLVSVQGTLGADSERFARQ